MRMSRTVLGGALGETPEVYSLHDIKANDKKPHEGNCVFRYRPGWRGRVVERPFCIPMNRCKNVLNLCLSNSPSYKVPEQSCGSCRDTICRCLYARCEGLGLMTSTGYQPQARECCRCCITPPTLAPMFTADAKPVCLKDAHPGYIGWEEFMSNQARLLNTARRKRIQSGAPRRAQALLQGIAIFGPCARQMSLHYSGPKGDYPVYLCAADQGQSDSPRCQQVRALSVDRYIEQVLLEALTPEQITLAVEALGELESQTKLLNQQWRLKCERARYEVEGARCQYDEVEPENRLVARSLEHAWEQKLRQQETVDQAYQAW